MNELESGIITLVEKEGNVSALKQSVNSFTRSDALVYDLTPLRGWATAPSALGCKALQRAAAEALYPKEM